MSSNIRSKNLVLAFFMASFALATLAVTYPSDCSNAERESRVPISSSTISIDGEARFITDRILLVLVFPLQPTDFGGFSP
jgi:hypothetical protein